tara:strand:+ start:703 stop:1140 length:438 start_codon:yes stop_codon:yes gene_type:complete
MIWWGWMILGFMLLGAELFAIDVQFYFVFLGISAALLGIADLTGIVLPQWAQWIAFAVISLIFFFTFRKGLYEKIRGGAIGFKEGPYGDIININEDIEVGSEVRIEYRGSKWTARNIGNLKIVAGSRAKVVKVDSLTLYLDADEF